MTIFIELKRMKALGGTIWPFIFIRDIRDVSTIHHQKIHAKQQLELWWIGFFVVYLYFHFTRKETNPFELEADEYEHKPAERKRFGWRAYV